MSIRLSRVRRRNSGRKAQVTLRRFAETSRPTSAARSDFWGLIANRIS
jgi:hypothetical protein